MWMKLGIVPERIAAGHPEQNGRHERMHRTLKQETASPPQRNRRAQQLAFDRFRQEYNHVRPHEALQMQTPADVYVPSRRVFPARVPEPEYDRHLEVRKVNPAGEIAWCGHRHVFLSQTLSGECVGLEALDDRRWCVWFCILRQQLQLKSNPADQSLDDDYGGRRDADHCLHLRQDFKKGSRINNY